MSTGIEKTYKKYNEWKRIYSTSQETLSMTTGEGGNLLIDPIIWEAEKYFQNVIKWPRQTSPPTKLKTVEYKAKAFLALDVVKSRLQE